MNCGDENWSAVFDRASAKPFTAQPSHRGQEVLLAHRSAPELRKMLPWRHRTSSLACGLINQCESFRASRELMASSAGIRNVGYLLHAPPSSDRRMMTTSQESRSI